MKTLTLALESIGLAPDAFANLGLDEDLEASNKQHCERVVHNLARIHDAKRWKKLIPTPIKNLVIAEEVFLIKMGWHLKEICEAHSIWVRSDLVETYSRNHAIIIAKSECPAIGIL